MFSAPPLSPSRMLLLLLVALACPSASVLTFLNPPASPDGTGGELADNPVYDMGSLVVLQWAGIEKGVPISIILYQMVRPDMHHNFTQPMETIVQSVVDISVYRWIVATRKNLTFSNLFMMGLYREGNTNSESNTHYFNIVRAAGEAETTVIKTITAPTSTAAGSTSPAGVGGGGNNFPTGAAVGAGVGGALAAVLAVSAGWWALRRWKRKKIMASVIAPPTEDVISSSTYVTHVDYTGGRLNPHYPTSRNPQVMPLPQEQGIHKPQEMGHHDSRTELDTQPAQSELQ